MQCQEGKTTEERWAKSVCHVQIMVYSRKKIYWFCYNHTTAGAAHVSDCTREESLVNVTTSADTPLQRKGGNKRGGCLVPSFRQS